MSSSQPENLGSIPNAELGIIADGIFAPHKYISDISALPSLGLGNILLDS